LAQCGTAAVVLKKTKFGHSLLPLKYCGTRTAVELKEPKFEHSLLLFKYRGTRAAAVVEKTKFEYSLLPLKYSGTRVLHGLPLSLFCSPVIFYLVECLFQHTEHPVSNM
jgi:hypothetical protein